MGSNPTPRTIFVGGEVILPCTKQPIYEFERRFKARAGISQTTWPYHLCLLRPDRRDYLSLNGRDVKYAKKHLDLRGGGTLSMAQRIVDFLKGHKDRPFSSKRSNKS